MISHKHKFIFIHIPKCAGSSIKDFYFNTPKLDWKIPNYDFLYGWCPKRRIHLQHATPKQLIETNLIKEEIWNNYYKFTFVRNPWDRAYSDYFWMMKDRSINGSFKKYINKEDGFKDVLLNRKKKEYRGDHLLPQVDFVNNEYLLDFIGKFERLTEDIEYINSILDFKDIFNVHAKKNKNRYKHYSLFYTNSNKKLVQEIYQKDIEKFGYDFQDMRKGIYALKKII